MRLTLLKIALFATGAGLLASTGAIAPAPAIADTPEQQVEARQDFMSGLGSASKTISEYLRDEGPTLEDVIEAAANLDAAAPNLPDYFPEGTAVGVSDSEALPLIWEDQDGFMERAEALRTAAAAMNEAAASEDRGEIAAGFRALGQTCSACHDNYRE